MTTIVIIERLSSARPVRYRTCFFRLAASAVCAIVACDIATSSRLVHVADVSDHHGNDRNKEHHRERGTPSILAGPEHLVVHHVRDDIGVELTARHDEDDIEYLENKNYDSGGYRQNGTAHKGDDDLEEDAELPGPVYARGLEQTRRHSLHGRREDNHRESGLEPDHDDNQEEVVPRLESKPSDGITAEPDDNSVQQADLL